MGLVPALLYSGASSTVSTLWSISDGDGADFAAHFFESFLQQCVNQSNNKVDVDGRKSSCIIDMAKAVSAAVRKMDSGQTTPLYHWAGFVLHGFWRYPLSKGDAEWIQRQSS